MYLKSKNEINKKVNIKIYYLIQSNKYEKRSLII